MDSLKNWCSRVITLVVLVISASMIVTESKGSSLHSHCCKMKMNQCQAGQKKNDCVPCGQWRKTNHNSNILQQFLKNADNLFSLVDDCFSADSSQSLVYDKSARHLIADCTNSIHTSCLVHSIAISGDTHTMSGPDSIFLPTRCTVDELKGVTS
jgi:hypothetical protein